MVKDRVANTVVISLGIFIGLLLFAYTLQKVIEAKMQEAAAKGGNDLSSNISSVINFARMFKK